MNRLTNPDNGPEFPADKSPAALIAWSIEAAFWLYAKCLKAGERGTALRIIKLIVQLAGMAKPADAEHEPNPNDRFFDD